VRELLVIFRLLFRRRPPRKTATWNGIKMKAIFLILTLLVLMSACASTDGNKLDPKVAYGGSYRVRGTVSHGVGK
jgi:hypothetical protein